MDQVVVDCTPIISKTCIYGISQPTYYSALCRYSAVTGKCRSVGPEGCPARACTKYSRVSKTNPRLKGMEEPIRT